MPRMTHSDLLAYQARRSAKVSPLYAGNGCEDEGELQQAIENYLKSLGTECWWTRSRMDRPTTQRCGVPDFIVIHRGVVSLIECKRKGKKATPEQRAELHWAALAGARTGVAYSLEDAIRILNGN